MDTTRLSTPTVDAAKVIATLLGNPSVPLKADARIMVRLRKKCDIQTCPSTPPIIGRRMQFSRLTKTA